MGSSERPLSRGFSSFRARVFWSVIPIVLFFLVFQGWMNVREHRRLVTEEFEKRGQALASNLGFASELGAFSEDKLLLEAAMRGTLTAFLILLVFALAGTAILTLFGITIHSFRIAGGLLLFWIAFEMIFEKRQQRHEKSAETANWIASSK